MSESEQPQVEITVTRSALSDGAVVIFIDTNFEPGDDLPGLRVRLNDELVYEGVPLSDEYDEYDRPAGSKTFTATLHEIDYQEVS